MKKKMRGAHDSQPQHRDPTLSTLLMPWTMATPLIDCVFVAVDKLKDGKPMLVCLGKTVDCGDNGMSINVSVHGILL